MAVSKPKVAVIGAGNIGTFHFREFLKAGAEVAFIVGSSQQSAERAAEKLHEKFGVKPRAYGSLDRLLEKESLDAVSICTPPALHYAQTKQCLEAGLNVMCEKPFVQETAARNYEYAKALAEVAQRQGLLLTVNTQWPSTLDSISKFVDLGSVTTFSMFTQPGDTGGAMLSDHLSHTNSILVRIMPAGRAENIRFEKRTNAEVSILFTYRNSQHSCEVKYEFKHKADRPREVRLEFNKVEFRREVGENYKQFLVTGNTRVPIEDPLTVSIRTFVSALRGEGQPLVSLGEILENVELQDKIISEFQKQ